MKVIINTSDAPAPIGPYNQAILLNDTLYVSGQIPLNPATGKLVEGDIKDQALQVMKNLDAILKAAGMNFSNVVKSSIFLKDMKDFPNVNLVYGTFFKSDPPARETVQVAGLPMNVDVEISCIAVK
ncbi:MAG TPA: RidA family protein [Bacteroidales bacterium]|nr:RidA family protein [Bacteroidales bacterium]